MKASGPDSPATSPRFRTADNSDSAAVKALVFSVLAEYGLKPDPACTDADLDDLEGHYDHRGGRFDVIEAPDGAIVGSVGLLPCGDGVCEVRKMYLLSAYRGRGLGRQLLEFALDQARRLGFRRVVLETATVLDDAVRLYTRYGFRPYEPEHKAARCDLAMYLDL